MSKSDTLIFDLGTKKGVHNFPGIILILFGIKNFLGINLSSESHFTIDPTESDFYWGTILSLAGFAFLTYRERVQVDRHERTAIHWMSLLFFRFKKVTFKITDDAHITLTTFEKKHYLCHLVSGESRICLGMSSEYTDVRAIAEKAADFAGFGIQDGAGPFRQAETLDESLHEQFERKRTKLLDPPQPQTSRISKSKEDRQWLGDKLRFTIQSSESV